MNRVATALLFLAPCSGAAQTVSVGENVRLPTSAVPHVEPHLAASPDDPAHLVVAAVAFDEGPRLRVFVSRDGGAFWRAGGLAADTRGEDPWLAFRAGGTLLLSALPGVVRVSTDGGVSWPIADTLDTTAGPHDYSKLAISPDGTALVWTVQSLREGEQRSSPPVAYVSPAPGMTFDGPRRFPVDALDHQVGAAVWLPDGTLLAPFHEISWNGDRLSAPRLRVARIEPGMDQPTVHLVTENFLADSPDIAADPSTGMAFMAWTGLDGDTSWNAFVARSADGRTWQISPVLTEPQPRQGYLPHHPMVAVDAHGRVGITWQAPRYDLGERCFQLVFSLSTDAGATWMPPVTVAAQPSCNDVAGNQVPVREGAAATVARRFGDGGDYHGLVAIDDGFLAVWADSRSGRYQLHSARIRVRQ